MSMKPARILVAVLWSMVGLCFHTARAADSDVIINEMMYHPSEERDDLQYVELYNRGTNATDLSKWAFTKGINYTFPDNTKLAPDAYLVVAVNLQAFKTFYGRDIPAVGNFTGHLKHKGDRVELSNPQKK